MPLTSLSSSSHGAAGVSTTRDRPLQIDRVSYVRSSISYSLHSSTDPCQHSQVSRITVVTHDRTRHPTYVILPSTRSPAQRHRDRTDRPFTFEYRPQQAIRTMSFSTSPTSNAACKRFAY